MKSKTGEPNHNELTLFDASKAQRDHLNVSLVGNTVDLGAWKYKLRNVNGRYDLYNPEVEKRNQMSIRQISQHLIIFKLMHLAYQVTMKK